MSPRHPQLRGWTCCFALIALGGCSARTDQPASSRSDQSAEARPIPSSPRRDVIPPDRQEHPKYSYDTEKDRRFADFLRDNSGGMVRQAAVGVERSGKVRIQLDRTASPDDTLPLTKSIVSGARKDFPGRAFILSVYDPEGAPILRARVADDGDVRYEVAHDEGEKAASPRDASPGSGPATDPLARPGRTEADRKFAAWAEDHGRKYLRYVQADLERHGRLWFGVTRDVRPDDVPDLTRSLLEGAHREFPAKDIVATVFDPSGERIGRAHLGSDGQTRWEH